MGQAWHEKASNVLSRVRARDEMVSSLVQRLGGGREEEPGSGTGFSG